VTVAHSKTRDLPAVCRGADILVAAVGRPRMVRGDWIKPGAVVIDVGINRIAGEGGRRRGRQSRRRDHARAGRRRADDRRVPAWQHADGVPPPSRPGRALNPVSLIAGRRT
jgi:hypothetical protein